MGDAATVIQPGDEHWSTTTFGDDHGFDEAAMETLGGFESPKDLAAKYIEAQNADWRAPMAGEDTKFLSTLQRYNTPEDLGNAFREQKQLISAGNLQKPLGEDATDDDIKAYREANGIPLESKAYLENLPDGLVVGDEDKVIFEDFFEHLHGKNVQPEIAHDIIGWYNDFAQREQDAQADLDVTQSTEANDQLREDWGSDYRANINLVNGMISATFGKEAAEQLMNGRYPDGRAFMNDPGVLKGFAEIARKMNPIMELGDNGGDVQQTLNDEIAELEKYMSEKRTEYNKDVPAQERLRKLYDIRIQHNNAQ